MSNACTEQKTLGSKRVFYGWIMVGLSFLVQGLGIGNQYLVGLFIQPFQERFHASSAAVVLVTMSMMSLVGGSVGSDRATAWGPPLGTASCADQVVMTTLPLACWTST